MFKRMVNPQASKHYDPKFAADYDDAIEERGPVDQDRPQIWSGGRRQDGQQHTTSGGYTKSLYLTHDQLEQFLDLVRAGVLISAAARQIDPPTSITQINRRAARDSDFAESFREAKEEGFDAFKEDLRAEAVRQAFSGDYRALKDQMLMHLPEAKTLMTTKHEVTGLDGGAIRMLAEQVFSDLPPEMLESLIAEVEKQEEQKQIGPGDG
jgi:hypothetical protein